MEWFVGAFVVLGLIAVAVRFLLRDAEGGVALPRIVDESVGMYTLRRLTGLPLGERVFRADRDWFGRDVGVRRVEPSPLRRRAPKPTAVAPTVRRPANQRPSRTRRPGLSGAPLRLGAVVAVAIMGFAVGAVLGQPSPQGQVLSATGTPEGGLPSVPGPSRFPAVPASADASGSPPQH